MKRKIAIENGEHEKPGNAKKEEYHFLREVIKKKPLDKRQILYKAGGIIGGAIIFGIVAAFVFSKHCPIWSRKKKKELTSTRTGESTEKNVSDSEEKKEELSENTPAPTQEPVKDQSKEVSLEDFESAYEEILKVAAEPERSIVTVQGITSDVDWMNNAYEDSNQVSGILAADDGKGIICTYGIPGGGLRWTVFWFVFRIGSYCGCSFSEAGQSDGTGSIKN